MLQPRLQSQSEISFPNQQTKQSNVHAILLVILLTIIGIGSIYIVKMQIDKLAVVTPSEVDSLSPTLKQNIEDDVNDWAVYRNEKFNYQLSYPKTWDTIEAKPRIGKKLEWEGDILNYNEMQKVTFITSDDKNFQFNFEVKVSSNIANLSLEALKYKILNETVTATGAKLASPEANIKIGEIDCLQFSVFAFDSSKQLVVAIKDNFIYQIKFDESNPNDPHFEKHLPIYSKMLSSFTFLN